MATIDPLYTIHLKGNKAMSGIMVPCYNDKDVETVISIYGSYHDIVIYDLQQCSRYDSIQNFKEAVKV